MNNVEKIFYLELTSGSIVGRIVKECNRVYKYKLISGTYPHSKVKDCYWVWKFVIDNELGDVKLYDSIDEYVVDKL